MFNNICAATTRRRSINGSQTKKKTTTKGTSTNERETTNETTIKQPRVIKPPKSKEVLRNQLHNCYHVQHEVEFVLPQFYNQK